MKNLSKLLLIAFIAVGIVSCSNDDNNIDEQQSFTIASFVKGNPDYSALQAALERTDLIDVLDGTTKFTVFAPNNVAFAALLSANEFGELNDVPVPLLKNLLLNHVVNGVSESSDLSTGYINSLATEKTSEANLSMYVNKSSNGVVLNGASTVTTADIQASNGVIHAVNTVISLPTVVTFATTNPTFSVLTAALTRDDQPDFAGILSTSGTAPAPFTVFAPTDDAFVALLGELGVSSLDDIDTATLTATLNTHVIAEANVRAEDLVDGVVQTLGADLIIDANNATITDPNGRVSNIIVVNVQAVNGVIHAIDKVLLPQL